MKDGTATTIAAGTLALYNREFAVVPPRWQDPNGNPVPPVPFTFQGRENTTAMAILDILEFPDPRLRTRAQAVAAVDTTLRTLVDDMLETMYDASGIGLAATQVNVHQRLLVMDTSAERDQPRVYINPEVEVLDPELGEYDEGCLSVPGFYETVHRPCRVRVSALDRNGEHFTEELNELSAICLQHEIDHLDGKLFVDYLSPLKRQRIRRKLEKSQRQHA